MNTRPKNLIVKPILIGSWKFRGETDYAESFEFKNQSEQDVANWLIRRTNRNPLVTLSIKEPE